MNSADAAKLIRQTNAGLSDRATRGILTDETIALLGGTCPSWDLLTFKAKFERWVNADPDRLPANWRKACIGWVKRHHAKHGHTLR